MLYEKVLLQWQTLQLASHYSLLLDPDFGIPYSNFQLFWRYGEKILKGKKKQKELDDIIKGLTLITDTSICPTLVSPIRLRFRANIGIPYSKSAIMRTWKSLECKRKTFRINFQQNGAFATVKTLPKSSHSSLNLDHDIGSL